MDSASFLRAIFGGSVSEQHKLVIWQESGKRAHWFTSIDVAAEFAAKHHHRCNTYFTCALHDEAKAREDAKSAPEFARGSVRSASVIGGIWIDMDVKNEQHGKAGLPTEMKKIVDVVMHLPLKPSIINTTGGGIHGWWLFKEPWILETDEERSRAQAIVEGFQQFVRKVADYTVDNTYDLSRILRLPGTLNHKYTPPRLAVASTPFEPIPRYNPSDFDDFAAKPRSITKVEVLHPLAIDLDVKPSAKLDVLLAHDLNFHAVWHRTKKFKSDSEYDMSLASRLVGYDEWTDQEICDVLIAHRRMHGGSMDRKDFNAEKLTHTIAKARKQHNDKRLQERNDEIANSMRMDQLDATLDELEAVRATVREQPILQIAVDEKGEPINAPVVPAAQPAQVEADQLVAAAFAIVNETLDIPKHKAFLRLVRFGGDNGDHVLYTMAGQVKVGVIENLRDHSKFAARIADGLQLNIGTMRSSVWLAPDGLFSRLLRLVERVDIGYGGAVEVSLTVLVQRMMAQDGLDLPRDAAMSQNKLFVHNGEVWLMTEGLMAVQNSLPAGFQHFKFAKEIGVALRRCDCESHEFNFRLSSKDGQIKEEGKGRNKRTAWKVTRGGRLIWDQAVVLLDIRQEGSDGVPF